jgi:hypothetical protein
MILNLNRYKSDEHTTLGKLSIEDQFECYALEDAYHKEKIYGVTRIPEGKYEVKLHTSGRMTEIYAKKFPEMHIGMLELQNVPNYTTIYIHIGNKDEDTLGCILIGKIVDEVNMKIYSSTVAYVSFYPKVIEALKIGQVFIQIVDNDLHT